MTRTVYHKPSLTVKPYLRIGVVTNCNLNCIFCRPPKVLHENYLKPNEFASVAKATTSYDVSEVHLTGGEPTLRQDLEEIIRQIRDISEIKEVSLTTNGMFSKRRLVAFREAGCDRVTFSLHSLDENVFSMLTEGGRLSVLMARIRDAVELGMGPIKINAVIMKGFNEDEIVPIGRLSIDLPLHIRFIELQPIGPVLQILPRAFVSESEMLGRLSDEFDLIPTEAIPGRGPAASNITFKLTEAAKGTIGFISNVTKAGCCACNRLRLTATGTIRGCILPHSVTDLRPILNNLNVLEERIGEIMSAMTARPSDWMETARRDVDYDMRWNLVTMRTPGKEHSRDKI